MNSNTRVSVHGYAGDQVQIISAMPLYLHHNCPVTIMSPTDSKIEIIHPGVETRFGGKRAYTGQESLDRQREHMKMLLEYPEDFFLCHDSDSICLSPEIPEYLYSEDVLWSNLVIDNIPGREHGYYVDGFPRLAFQPPYFFSRRVLERLLEPVKDENIAKNPTLPFIDHYMVQLAVKATVPWKNFRDGITGPISSDRRSFDLAWSAALRGAVMIHSVKAPEFWQPLVRAHELYLAGRTASPPLFPTPMAWSHEQHQERSRQMDEERRIALHRAGVPNPQQARQQQQLNLTAQRLAMQRRVLAATRRGTA